jgi:hypothetical protein
LNPRSRHDVSHVVIRRGRRALIPTLALGLGLLAAAPAQATFHLIKVREVYPGPGDGTGFVELQMYAEGQNELAGHTLTVYNSLGNQIHETTFQAGVTNGANQSTVLIGEENVATTLRVAPDLVDKQLNLPRTAGAVCWNSDGAPSDCVSWGNFTGNAMLSNSAGTPIAPGGLGIEQAILRKITPGCSTFLEPGDDTDDSAADFAILNNSPNPRNNATPPTETPCQGTPPQASIDEHPELHSNSHTATFTYGAPTAITIKCRLDNAPFAVCPATERTFTNVADGTHTFQVFGENAAGAGPTAGFSWTVDTVAPTTIIDTHPVDPSPGQAAAFTFHASEATLRFECSLAPEGATDSFSTCTSPKTSNGLANGTYIFKVRATDLAGNPQATPTQFTWQVDNGAADTTPPETTITDKPFDPSLSRTAIFAYSSNEPGSTFECSLDSAPFAACPATGLTYNDLGNGVHTFQVRAIDASGNVDRSPAAYTFTVVVVTHEEPPVAPQTSLVGKPLKRTFDRTPTFRFRASVAGASFRCAVDRGRFKSCRSPFTTPALRPGPHSFSVKAVASGLTDPTPVRVSFQVLKKRTG